MRKHTSLLRFVRSRRGPHRLIRREGRRTCAYSPPGLFPHIQGCLSLRFHIPISYRSNASCTPNDSACCDPHLMRAVYPHAQARKLCCVGAGARVKNQTENMLSGMSERKMNVALMFFIFKSCDGYNRRRLHQRSSSWIPPVRLVPPQGGGKRPQSFLCPPRFAR